MTELENMSLKAGMQDIAPSHVSDHSIGTTELIDLHSACLDGLNAQWRIIGWARPASSEGGALRVHLIRENQLIGTDIAKRFRGDLLDASIGDGHYGFELVIPPSLFDGNEHRLAIEIEGVPETDRTLGELNLFLPRSSPFSRSRSTKREKVSDLLAKVFSTRTEISEESEIAFRSEITHLAIQLARTYGYPVCLDLLYVHVLGRHIDEQGLQSRLSLLVGGLTTIDQVVEQILNSSEFKALKQSDHRFKFLTSDALKIWPQHNYMSEQY